MTDKLAVVIGNGTSRKGYPLREMFGPDSEITSYGCNAIYREYPNFDFPTFVVAIDPGMIGELHNSGFPVSRFIVPMPDDCWEPAELHHKVGYNATSHRPRSNAGINAVREAIKNGANKLICFGFDFLIADREASTSNMFHGTPNYGKETRAIYEENIGRQRYIEWVAKTCPEVTLYMVYPDNCKTVHVFMPNIKTLTYTELEKVFT